MFQAYHRSQSSAVQVAKIIAVTVVLVSIVLGSFLLASAYVTANASCRQLQQELELFNEAADKFQSPLAPEPLIQVNDFFLIYRCEIFYNQFVFANFLSHLLAIVIAPY
jgi:hypothetical protein